MIDVRPTEDIDIIIEIINYFERTKLEKTLRSKGFSHDIDSGIICRYKINGIIVDIMSTADDSVGFQNKWYSEGFKKAISVEIGNNFFIKILSAPYFIATKMEAFKNRGGGDGRVSHDFEDIIFVLENRQTIWDEFNILDGEIKRYLRTEFKKLYNNSSFFEWIDSHVELGNSPPASYSIYKSIENFISES